MTDLEQLSRDAAGCLPEELQITGELPGTANERVRPWRDAWLHESTEACAEIMVRVLWPKRIVVGGYQETVKAIQYSDDGQPFVLVCELIEGDPVRALRTVTLRALVAMKRKQT
jgi:hypothetical protein